MASTEAPQTSQKGPGPQHDASPGVGQPTTEYQYIQYKHRTPLHAVAATAKQGWAQTPTSAPGSHGAAPASLAQDGLRRLESQCTEGGQAEEERPARPA